MNDYLLSDDPFECINIDITDELLSGSKIAAYMFNQQFENFENKEKPFTPKAFPGKAIIIRVPINDQLWIEIYLDSEEKVWDSRIVSEGQLRKLSPDQMQQFFNTQFYANMIATLSKRWPISDPIYNDLFAAVVGKQLRIGKIPNDELNEFEIDLSDNLIDRINQNEFAENLRAKINNLFNDDVNITDIIEIEFTDASHFSLMMNITYTGKYIEGYGWSSDHIDPPEEGYFEVDNEISYSKDLQKFLSDIGLMINKTDEEEAISIKEPSNQYSSLLDDVEVNIDFEITDIDKFGSFISMNDLFNEDEMQIVNELEHSHKKNQPNKRIELANKDITGDGERDYTGSGRRIVHFGNNGVKTSSAQFQCWPREGKEFKWNSWKDWTKIKPFCKMKFKYNGREYMIALTKLVDEEFDNRGFRGGDLTWRPPFGWLSQEEVRDILNMSLTQKFIKQCKKRVMFYASMDPQEVLEKIDHPEKVTIKEIEKTQRVLRHNVQQMLNDPHEDNYRYEK